MLPEKVAFLSQGISLILVEELHVTMSRHSLPILSNPPMSESLTHSLACEKTEESHYPLHMEAVNVANPKSVPNTFYSKSVLREGWQELTWPPGTPRFNGTEKFAMFVLSVISYQFVTLALFVLYHAFFFITPDLSQRVCRITSAQ